MNYKTLSAALIAALVLVAGATAGVAALPGASDDAGENGNAPDDAGTQGHAPDEPGQSDGATDSSPENDTDANASESGPGENASATAHDAAGSQGPPTDLPSQVPDHVTQIHQAITDWLDGGKEGNLGHLISDIVGGDGEADGSDAAQSDENADAGSDNADEGSEDADETETATATPTSADE